MCSINMDELDGASWRVGNQLVYFMVSWCPAALSTQQTHDFTPVPFNKIDPYCCPVGNCPLPHQHNAPKKYFKK